MYVAAGLIELYSGDQVEEALVRFCKLMSVHPDDVTAIKRISKWKKQSLEVLIRILQQYETFQTLDVKDSSTRNKAKLMKGETQ